MLEKLVKNIGRKVATITLVGSLLFGSGCATYSTLNPISIQPVTPIERPIERPIDYSNLTWQEAIKYVQTPEQVQDYLDNHFGYDFEEAENIFFIPGLYLLGAKGETFKYNHLRGKGICFDYSTVAAALLSDNGYPPLLLNMSGESGSHMVFLYRGENGFGALGYTPKPPVYPSVQDLVNNLGFSKFKIFDIDKAYENREWVSGDMDLGIKVSPP